MTGLFPNKWPAGELVWQGSRHLGPWRRTCAAQCDGCSARGLACMTVAARTRVCERCHVAYLEIWRAEDREAERAECFSFTYLGGIA